MIVSLRLDDRKWFHIPKIGGAADLMIATSNRTATCVPALVASVVRRVTDHKLRKRLNSDAQEHIPSIHPTQDDYRGG
jgi:hypothetical protein